MRVYEMALLKLKGTRTAVRYASWVDSLPRRVAVMVRACFLALMLSAVPSQVYANLVDVVSEQFTGGFPNNQAGVTWTTTDSGGFEIYGAGGASVRDMNSTYDHDNDPMTPNISIPGAIEPNADDSDSSLIANFVLPASTDTSVDGTLSFFAGVRVTNAGDPPTIAVLNITDNTTLLVESNISINANDNIWEFSSLSVNLSASDLGDTLQLVFTGGGSGSANGLELTDVKFQVTTPEPSSLMLAAFGAIPAMLRRKRRRI